ncbi:MAG: reductase, partial [Pseudomonadota bacterium]
MARSVAIVGAGQIGFASALAFRDAGWDVRVLARSKPDWAVEDVEFVPHVLEDARCPSADVVLDTIAFDEADAARYDPDRIGRYISISTASVYADNQGRGFEDAAERGFPEFEEPISENQPLIEGSAATYSSRKVRMEDKAEQLFGKCATLLRPCAIYGPYSRQPREWWFVKRLLDGRSRIPLAFMGESQFHTTNVDTIAGFAVCAAINELGGAFNLADDDAPCVMEIGRQMMQEMDAQCAFVPFESPPKAALGRTPWSLPKPFVLSCRKAFDTGWDGFDLYPGV